MSQNKYIVRNNLKKQDSTQKEENSRKRKRPDEQESRKKQKRDTNVKEENITCFLCKKVEDHSCKKCNKMTICLDKYCSVTNGDQHFGCQEYLISGCENCFKQTKNASFCNECYIVLRDFINKTH